MLLSIGKKNFMTNMAVVVCIPFQASQSQPFGMDVLASLAVH